MQKWNVNSGNCNFIGAEPIFQWFCLQVIRDCPMIIMFPLPVIIRPIHMTYYSVNRSRANKMLTSNYFFYSRWNSTEGLGETLCFCNYFNGINGRIVYMRGKNRISLKYRREILNKWIFTLYITILYIAYISIYWVRD